MPERNINRGLMKVLNVVFVREWDPGRVLGNVLDIRSDSCRAVVLKKNHVVFYLKELKI
jgi:hypothetical protein